MALKRDRSATREARLAGRLGTIVLAAWLAFGLLTNPGFSEEAPAGCFEAAELGDGLIRGEASDYGFDQNALCAVLKEVRTGPENIHSLLVMRRDRLVAELYRQGQDRSIYSLWQSRIDFGPTNRHDMRSISKSVVSLLYGILLSRGQVPGLSTPVTSLYSEYLELDQPARRAIEIRHLLTMSSGLDWNEPSSVRRVPENDEISLFWTWSVYRCVFQHDIVAAPGERFTYSSGATAVIADIMARATHRSLRDIARTELFEPLGITDWEWVGDIYANAMASSGLRLRPRDLMKIGSMVLAGGRWQSRQIVPAEWIAQSTQPYIMTGPTSGYGFQWWSNQVTWKARRLGVTIAIGNGGQRLFLIPDLELAVVATAGAYDDRRIGPSLNQLLQRIVETVTR
jgi:CubicO group peptidase (beta-lactamase class C family)